MVQLVQWIKIKSDLQHSFLNIQLYWAQAYRCMAYHLPERSSENLQPFFVWKAIRKDSD